MEDNKDFGLTNEGTDGITQIPVELKDHSKDPVIVPEVKVEAPVVEKKKRGRPKKVATSEPMREWYCGTCRETIIEKNAMVIGCGDNRKAIFCGQCQKSLGFLQPDLDKRVQDLIDNNPTGK